jgi:hypothetical protein
MLTLIFQHRRRRPLIPHSSYYYGPPASDSAYGTPPVGQIGVHHPREIVRIERDYAGGELTQFSSIYPIELDGRVLHAPIRLLLWVSNPNLPDNTDPIHGDHQRHQRDSNIRT